jgi:quinol monooxygenase YgiN|tara:strand:- start:365 stop:646 length:282 start_codon:yes stop_codon:yes gene_type:complete
MIGVIATLKIKEGSGKDFEAVATKLVEKVNANEEGVLYYDLYKDNETTYIFLEKYKDQEAQKIHGKTDYFRALGAEMGAFMTEAPDIKMLELI